MTSASAPAKIILFGEHAVVYGRPAIAVPIEQRPAHVHVEDSDSPGIHIRSLATGDDFWLHEAEADQPLAQAVRLTLAELPGTEKKSLDITIESDIPIAAGLGSGAAVSVALIRAVSRHLGAELTLMRQSDLAYQVEVLHHGTPSGIDNTVISYGQPVYFVRDSPPELLTVGAPIDLVVADSGTPSHTGPAVAGVRERWHADEDLYDGLFDRMGAIAELARKLIEDGRPLDLGPLMDQNHALLAEIGVSNDQLDKLVAAARSAGAAGAKLSGAGVGGNVVCLCSSERADTIRKSLLAAGANSAFQTQVTA
ncbi:MAG: mevalonate kinase [Anaerolineales bacterium]